MLIPESAIKASNINNILKLISGEAGESGAKKADELIGEVSWLYAGATKRARAVAGLPRTLANGEDEIDETGIAAEMSLSTLLFKTELAWIANGLSFVMIAYNASGVPGIVRYVDYAAIEMDQSGRYVRTLGDHDKQVFEKDSDGRWLTVWRNTPLELFPLSTPSLRETGAGLAAAKVAGLDANILRFLNLFVSGYFERGAMPVTMVKGEGVQNIPKEQKDSYRNYFKRLFGGVSKAHEIQVVDSRLTFERLQSNLNELVLPELEESKIGAVCAALETPRPILDGSATNRGDSDNIKKGWYEDLIIPEGQLIADSFNDGPLMRLGYKLVFKPQQMTIMQADEVARSDALVNLVNAGESLANAYTILGYDLPEDYKAAEPVAIPVAAEPSKSYDSLCRDSQRSATEETDPATAEAETLHRWAKKRVKAGKSLEGFKPDHLNDSEVTTILEEYAEAQDSFFLKSLKSEHFSPLDDILELRQAKRLRGRVKAALTNQYEKVNIGRVIRAVGIDGLSEDTPELRQAVEENTPAFEDGTDAAALLALLAYFARLGKERGIDQGNRDLTQLETIDTERELNDYVTKRLQSLIEKDTQAEAGLPPSPDIRNPYIERGLDYGTYASIVMLLLRAYRHAQEEEARTTQKRIRELYDMSVKQEIDRRADLIAQDNITRVFGAAVFIAVSKFSPIGKTWLRTKSADPREIHLDQVGVKVPFGARFPDGSFWSNELVNCKCGIRVGF